MEEALLFVQEAQGWILFFLALAALAYLRQAWLAFRDFRRSTFRLERERSGSRLSRAGAMLALVFAAAGATFVVGEFFGPAVPSSDRPTPIPTVPLLTTPVTAIPPIAGGFTTATPLPPLEIDSSGCLNQLATLTEPAPEAQLLGEVAVRGTAAIPDFAFYRFEYVSLTPGSTWKAIAAGTVAVVNGDLGVWDTQLVTPGTYAFRLVVTDASGNAPAPCVVRVQVLPGG